ncbi:disease resistance protein RML1B-like [Ziziphus jujuba]|uniref:Disease resistance protein RML1B-like n=1 Tax=Ziziphus jujuba TaxID=326968 RepID=A0ABM4A936_ZIZJJ|nr:disease resistance protein RML1B-like [Ziziphus jujuba]
MVYLHLQNILYKTLVDSSGSIRSYEMGINVLRKRLNSRRLLIILDDVDNFKQIEALVGNGEQQNEWLGPGSRVIVTTRNKHLLKLYGENNIYNVDKMTNDEALQLLCQKAFKHGNLLDGYVKLSDSVVGYAKGNPLALEVLGSFLLGRSVEEWSDTLAKLKEDLDKDIFRTLQVSFE